MLKESQQTRIINECIEFGAARVLLQEFTDSNDEAVHEFFKQFVEEKETQYDWKIIKTFPIVGDVSEDWEITENPKTIKKFNQKEFIMVYKAECSFSTKEDMIQFMLKTPMVYKEELIKII